MFNFSLFHIANTKRKKKSSVLPVLKVPFHCQEQVGIIIHRCAELANEQFKLNMSLRTVNALSEIQRQWKDIYGKFVHCLYFSTL